MTVKRLFLEEMLEVKLTLNLKISIMTLKQAIVELMNYSEKLEIHKMKSLNFYINKILIQNINQQKEILKEKEFLFIMQTNNGKLIWLLWSNIHEKIKVTNIF